MKVTSVKVTKTKTDTQDFRVVSVVMVSSSTPSTLPTTGAGIEGLEDTDKFAPFSVLFVTDPAATHQVYIANESGVFVGQ